MNKKKQNQWQNRVLVIVTFMLSCLVAQAQVTNLSSFFSYHDNQAYKLISFLAHPTNSFRSGYCEVSGEYIFLTINSTRNYTRMKIHRNGSRFDRLEFVDEDDFPPAFSVTNLGKDIAIDFWRSFDTKTLQYIENSFGRLNNLSCEQMCLAALTGLMWEYPYSISTISSSSSSSHSSSNSSSNISSRDRDFFYETVLSSRKLTESDLFGKSKEELSIMRNRIYAHHGYRFKRDDLFNYFRIYSWYNPFTSDPAPLWNRFSETERYNIEFIKNHER